MCKYCDLERVGERELSNKGQYITGIKNGVLNYSLYLNRYIVEGEKTRNNTLEFGLDVVIDGMMTNLKTKEIKIKYCPFCGEKL